MQRPLVQGISDQLVEKAGLSFKFVNNQEFALTAFRGPVLASTQDKPTGNKLPVNVHHLRPDFTYNEPVLRALLTECSNTFLGLQKNPNQDLYKISLTYRSAIRACLEALQVNADLNENVITVFYSIECIWHLFELLFLSRSAENLVVHHLLEWAYFHFPKSGSFALEMMQMGREVDTDPNYWSALKDLVAKGKIDIARTLLQIHVFSGSTEFRFVDEILSKVQRPVVGASSRSSEVSEWQLRIQNGCLAAEPELEEIAKLVTGDKSAWTSLCRTSECWYEYFPGYLYYTDPSCKTFKLPQYVNSWLSQWLTSQASEVGRLNHLDRVILGIMEGDIQQVLHDIQNMCDDKWFATHLTDLLWHFVNGSSGESPRFVEDPRDMQQLRDSLVFDFGGNLMSQPGFWRFGVDYLEHCPDGPPARQLLLARIPFKTEQEAFKIISAAKKVRAFSVETDVCRVLARRNLSSNRLGNALQWAIRSGDKTLITSIVNLFLRHYIETGELPCEDVLASVGAKMFASPSLVFLVKYFDFHEYYRERSFTQAADLLVNLLDSSVTPPFLWPSLISDTIPLLEFKEPVIPSKETFAILQHVENDLVPWLEAQKRKKEQSSSNTLNGNPEQLVQLVRLACARNLSRCLVIENVLGP